MWSGNVVLGLIVLVVINGWGIVFFSCILLLCCFVWIGVFELVCEGFSDEKGDKLLDNEWYGYNKEY